MNESYDKNELVHEISKLEYEIKILEESNDNKSYTNTEVDEKKEILDNIAKEFGYVFEDPYIIKLEKIEKKLEEQPLTIGFFNEYMKEINEAETRNPILQESEINEMREILKKEEPKKEEPKKEEPKKEELKDEEIVKKEEVIEKTSLEKLIEQLTELASEQCTACNNIDILKNSTNEIISVGLHFNLDLTNKLKKIIDNNTDNEKIKSWLTKECKIHIMEFKGRSYREDENNKGTDYPYDSASHIKMEKPTIVIDSNAIDNLTHLDEVYEIIVTQKVIETNKLKKNYDVMVVDPLQDKDNKNNYSEMINDLIKDLKEQKGGEETIEKRIRNAIRKKTNRQKQAELRKKFLKIKREELRKKKAIWEEFNSITKNKINTIDYSGPLMALISYKIGNLNQYDIRIIEYCQNANLNDQVIIAIILAQKKADISAIFQNYRIISHGLLLNILRLKKLSAEFQFRQDYGIHNDQHLFVLAQKQRIW